MHYIITETTLNNSFEKEWKKKYIFRKTKFFFSFVIAYFRLVSLLRCSLNRKYVVYILTWETLSRDYTEHRNKYKRRIFDIVTSSKFRKLFKEHNTNNIFHLSNNVY